MKNSKVEAHDEEKEHKTVHIKDESREDIKSKIENGYREIKNTDKYLRVKIWRSHFEAMGVRANLLEAYEFETPKIELDIVGREKKVEGYLEMREELKERDIPSEKIEKILYTLYKISALQNAGKYMEVFRESESAYDVPPQKKLRVVGIPLDWAKENLSTDSLEKLEQLDLIYNSANTPSWDNSLSFDSIRTTEKGEKIAEEYFIKELWNNEAKESLENKIEEIPLPFQYSILHRETSLDITQDIQKRPVRTADNEDGFDQNCLVCSVFDEPISSISEYDQFWKVPEDYDIAVKGPKVSRTKTIDPNDITTEKNQDFDKDDRSVRYIPLFASKKILELLESKLPRGGLVPRLLMYLNRRPAKDWSSEREKGLPQYGMTKKKNLSDLKKMIDHLHENDVASAWVDREIPYTLDKSKFKDYVEQYLLGQTEIDIK
ncbi:MAG: hypothetical protein ACOC87_02715 [Candidatus Natronoplasma sp.]